MVAPDVVMGLGALLLGVVIPIWAIIDAASRPAVAFYAAGSNKVAWVAVLVVTFSIGLGFLLGGFYLLSTRRKIRSQGGTFTYR
jgi:hypothetical protein